MHFNSSYSEEQFKTDMMSSMWYIKWINDEKGNGLFAACDVQAGSTILEEDPLISCQLSWNSVYKYQACDYCMKSLESAQDMCRRLCQNESIVLPHEECCSSIQSRYVTCPNCKVLYCSAQCCEKAQKEYHQVMCPASGICDPKAMEQLDETWRSFHYPPETATIMLLVRILARLKQEGNKEAFIATIEQFFHKSENASGEIVHKLLGDKFEGQMHVLYEQFKSLMYDDVVSHWFTYEGFQSLIALLGANQQGIGSSALSVWVHNCDELDLPESERKDLDEFIDRLYEELDNVAGTFLNCEGAGLFLVQSKCNHSCSPNCEASFPHNNHRLSLRAINDIKKDEEITISYLSECELSRSRHSRQKFLRENYVFSCRCDKCSLQSDDPDITSEEDDCESDDDMK